MFSRSRSTTSRRSHRYFNWDRSQRLTLQRLEDRTVPATFLVTNTADSGAGSLRDAIAQADASADPTDVVDATGISGTIVLASTLSINETTDVTIKGAGNLTIDGNNLVRLFFTGDYNFVNSAKGANISFQGLTMTKGKSTAGGGAGIYAYGQNISINNCTITGNSSSGDGGAITHGYYGYSLNIVNSTISNNVTSTDGGAIGVYSNSPVSISNSTISGNSASSSGGGIYFFSGGSLTIEGSTLSGNIANSSPGGGAIYFFGTAGTFNIRNSTISGNTATNNAGGGIVLVNFGGNAKFENSTVTQNKSNGAGGGIARTGGIGTIELVSTIVAQNINATVPDISLNAADNIAGDDNLIGVGNAGLFTLTGTGNQTGTLATPLNAQLGGLGANGGSTLTHLPSLLSPAVNMGNNLGGFANDQRGVTRVIGAKADVGAVEVDPNVPSASGTFANVTIGGAAKHQVQIKYADAVSIKISTFDDFDIRIKGPNLFNVLAKFVGPSVPGTNAAIETATYEFNTPGGTWDGVDNGLYTVSMEPSQVQNSGLNFVPGGSLGTFSVAIPITYLVDEVSDVDDADLNVGKLSLREAIKAANGDSAPSVIEFDSSVAKFGSAQSWVVATEMLISEPVTIKAPAALLTLDGTGRIFNVDLTTTGGAVSIAGMTLQKSAVTGLNGAAILNVDANLALSKMTIKGNSTDLDGGGISSSYNSSLSLTDCVVTGNKATGSSSNGGGINLGSGASLTLVRSTVSNNEAGEDGGGVYFFSGGTLTMDDSTVSGNKANLVGAYPTGGAGVYLFGTTANIRNSTISGNSGKGNGGGIVNQAASTVTIKNSTIAFNTTTGAGGGIGGGSVTLESVIVSNNSGGTSPDVVTVTANYSLIGNTTGATISGANNVLGSPASLASLNNYGGPTETHGLLPGSPAVDKGSNVDSLLFDQRGTPFNRKIGPAVDIGAFEGTLTVPAGSLVSFGPIIVAGSTPNTLQVVYTDDTGILDSSIDIGDIEILDPSSNPLVITFASISPGGNVTPQTATYTFTPPGTNWDGGDNGTYTVKLKAGEISDISSNTNFGATLGTFKVAIPIVYLVDEVSDTDDLDLSVGKLSLREAIKAANGDSAPSVINFDSSIAKFGSSQTITVASEMSITQSVTINAPAALLTLDGTGGAGRLIALTMATPGDAVSIAGMKLQNAKVTGVNGGAIDNNGAALTLSKMTITGNETDSDGGGISLSGSSSTLSMTDCVVSNNKATGVSSNGGGINIGANSTVSLLRCTISGNESGEDGGGVYFFSGGNLSVNESTISGNKADLSGTYPSGGGGVYLFSTTATFRNSTISGNSTSGGATNGPGGGIAARSSSTLVLQNSTVSFNDSGTESGGGIYNSGASTITMDSTIVSNNTGTVANEIDSAVTANFSLIGDSAGDSTGATIAGANNVIDMDPMLDVLAIYGGPTETHRLKSGSAALNAGSNVVPLSTDQRGGLFLRTIGSQTDIGAFEVQAAPPTVSTVVPNGGGAQRSNVFSIVITFSESVTFSGPVVNAFTLTRANAPLSATEQPGVNGKVNIVAAPITGPTSTVTLTFATSGAEPIFGVNNVYPTPPNSFVGYSLPDGTYNLAIDGTQVSGLGGNMASYSQTGSSASGDKLYRLFGDLNGDGAVSNSDFNAFKVAFAGGVNVAFDYNNDGDVANNDFNQLKTRFGSSMP